jgi:hypothetical protein
MGRVGVVLLFAVLVMSTGVSTSQAATPAWYPQLKIAVADAVDAGAAIGACAVPKASSPKAGRRCALTAASDDSSVLDRVEVYTATGTQFGPCRRLLWPLDHTTSAAAAKALDFATDQEAPLARDLSGRRALQQVVAKVTRQFRAVQHCLGKA